MAFGERIIVSSINNDIQAKNKMKQSIAHFLPLCKTGFELRCFGFLSTLEGCFIDFSGFRSFLKEELAEGGLGALSEWCDRPLAVMDAVDLWMELADERTVCGADEADGRVAVEVLSGRLVPSGDSPVLSVG